MTDPSEAPDLVQVPAVRKAPFIGHRSPVLAHTPGPWIALSPAEWDGPDGKWVIPGVAHCGNGEFSAGNARLISAAPDMLAALLNVRRLVSEAAMTGFNWKDGDWAERLFASQHITSAAIAKATGAQP